MRAVASGDYLRGCALFVDYWSPGAWDALPATKRVAMASRLAKVALDFHATFSERAKAEEWRAIRAPTLLVTGDLSLAFLLRLTDRLEELLPIVERVEIPGASHGMHEENAPALNEAVLGFLGRHRGRPVP